VLGGEYYCVISDILLSVSLSKLKSKDFDPKSPKSNKFYPFHFSLWSDEAAEKQFKA